MLKCSKIWQRVQLFLDNPSRCKEQRSNKAFCKWSRRFDESSLRDVTPVTRTERAVWDQPPKTNFDAAGKHFWWGGERRPLHPGFIVTHPLRQKVFCTADNRSHVLSADCLSQTYPAPAACTRSSGKETVRFSLCGINKRTDRSASISCIRANGRVKNKESHGWNLEQSCGETFYQPAEVQNEDRVRQGRILTINIIYI